MQVQGENGVQKNVGGKMTKQVFKYRGLYGTMRVIIREEGVRGLYSGIVPGLQRQMCFASLRIGFYDDVKKMYLNVFQKGMLLYVLCTIRQHNDGSNGLIVV